MKVITKTVEITVYVADDGAEFMHKENCLYHEERTNSIKRLKWRGKIFKDLENFVDSYDSGDCVPLCDNTIIVGNFVLHQNAGERRTTILNIKTGRVGKAICNSSDKFNRRMGWAIAWARYKGDEIPDYI